MFETAKAEVAAARDSKSRRVNKCSLTKVSGELCYQCVLSPAICEAYAPLTNGVHIVARVIGSGIIIADSYAV
jgi:hypothetical protein